MGNNVGFGHGSFGGFPFGGVEWAKRVTVDVVPAVYLSRDNEQPGRPLQSFLAACRGVLEGMRRAIDGFHGLREPLDVPFGLVPVTFNQVEVGDTVVTLPRKLSGQLTFSNGSATVLGVGTSFLSQLAPGLAVAPAEGGVRLRVLSVDSDTSLTAGEVWQEATVASEDGEAVVVSERGLATYVLAYTGEVPPEAPQPDAYTSTDTRLVVALPLLEGQTPTRADYVLLDSTQVWQLAWMRVRDTTAAVALGSDFGVYVDDADSDSVSRSAIAGITQFLPLKGTARGYEAVGRAYGYDVEVLPLWHVDVTQYDPLLFAGKLFEHPIGSGDWYTPLAPKFLLFDEVPADVEPLDVWCDTLELVTYSTTVVSAGGGQVVLSGNVDVVLDGWTLVAGGDFYLTLTPTPGTFGYQALGTASVPALGAAALAPPCRLVETCAWCKSSKLSVELRALSPFVGAGPEVDRAIARLGEVKPLHVEIIRVSFVTEAVATLTLSAYLEVESVESSLIDEGGRFDVTASDDAELDAHIVAWGEATIFP